MDIKNAIKIVVKCAKIYEENLLNKNLLIVFKDKNDKFNILETEFLDKNFMHLTGIKTKNIKSKQFLKLALNSRLPLNLLSFSDDGTTVLKLSVLESAMNVDKLARMVGDFDGVRHHLMTDKLAGTTNMCMGFCDMGDEIFVPNTVLKEDIRNISKSNRILAIYKKSSNDVFYDELTYLAKNVDVSNFPRGVLELLQIKPC